MVKDSSSTEVLYGPRCRWEIRQQLRVQHLHRYHEAFSLYGWCRTEKLKTLQKTAAVSIQLNLVHPRKCKICHHLLVVTNIFDFLSSVEHKAKCYFPFNESEIGASKYLKWQKQNNQSSLYNLCTVFQAIQELLESKWLKFKLY